MRNDATTIRTRTIVHPPGLVQLPHARIHQWIAGLSLVPGGIETIPLRSRGTRYRYSILASERTRGYLRKRGQDLLEKLTPDQFIYPCEHVATRRPVGFGERIQGCIHGSSQRESPKPEVWRQLGCPVDRGEISSFNVRMDGTVKEPAEPPPRLLLSRFDRQGKCLIAEIFNGRQRDHG